jgi:hypothetical protein
MHRINLLPLAALILSFSAQGADVRIADRDTQGLIRALQDANQSQQSTTIRLARHGLYTLTQAAEGSPGLGLPLLKSNVVIDGNQAEIRRYSNADFTLLAVASGADVRINDLTLAEGSEGAILNHGTLELRRVKVVDNVARHQPAIIENYGEIRIVASEISFNQLDGAQRDAGTVVNYAKLYIDSSQIASNWISRRYDSLYAASAVLNYGDLRLRGVQIQKNTADTGQTEQSLGSVVNLGMGVYSGISVELSENEPPASNQIAAAMVRFAQ